LGNDSAHGQPENIPIFRTFYQGNRDTDPRFVILAKVDLGFTKAFAMTTHLTTLYGERGSKEIPTKNEEAQTMRWKQCERIIDLIQEFVLGKNELVFFLGDFNALPSEPALANSLKERGGFVHLIPQNNVGSHLKLNDPVDHIFIFPGKFHIKYFCNIIDDKFTASDHNPVVATIKIYDENSKPFKELGPGVFQEMTL
jgi:endonuclease/exonuclease/phosphatase family metal-dependent hydrolase